MDVYNPHFFYTGTQSVLQGFLLGGPGTTVFGELSEVRWFRADRMCRVSW